MYPFTQLFHTKTKRKIKRISSTCLIKNGRHMYSKWQILFCKSDHCDSYKKVLDAISLLVLFACISLNLKYISDTARSASYIGLPIQIENEGWMRTTKAMISILPQLCSFHLYVAIFKKHLFISQLIIYSILLSEFS